MTRTTAKNGQVGSDVVHHAFTRVRALAHIAASNGSLDLAALAATIASCAHAAADACAALAATRTATAPGAFLAAAEERAKQARAHAESLA